MTSGRGKSREPRIRALDEDAAEQLWNVRLPGAMM
jgi:hypothetical protein